VIGVLPADFEGGYSTRIGDGTQIWVSGLDRSNPVRVNHGYVALARLRPGMTLQNAQAEMDTIATQIEVQFPENKGWGVGVVSLHDELVGNSRPALVILMTAVSLVWLIVCANLANLLLARGTVRMRELALRCRFQWLADHWFAPAIRAAQVASSLLSSIAFIKASAFAWRAVGLVRPIPCRASGSMKVQGPPSMLIATRHGRPSTAMRLTPHPWSLNDPPQRWMTEPSSPTTCGCSR